MLLSSQHMAGKTALDAGDCPVPPLTSFPEKGVRQKYEQVLESCGTRTAAVPWEPAALPLATRLPIIG